MQAIGCDFETYSECDLKAHGAWLYSLHPSTDILCLAYKVKGAPGRPRLWRPGMAFPEILAQAIAEGWEFHAFNAAFEKAIWLNVAMKKLGWPPIPVTQWRCDQAKATFNGLPRKLEKICELLELGDRGKDAEGHKVMQVVSKPRRHKDFPRWTPERDRAKFDRLYAYCGRDVSAEEIISAYCDELPPMELAIWQLDQKINRRGVPIDVALCEGACQVLAEVHRRATKTVQEILDDETANPDTLPKIKAWLASKGIELAPGAKRTPALDEPALTEMLTWDLPSDRTRRVGSPPSRELVEREEISHGPQLATQRPLLRPEHLWWVRPKLSRVRFGDPPAKMPRE